MGKLKNSLIAFEEQRACKQKPILDPRSRGMVDSDEEWAIYEAEFNDWLDRYEQSFGQGEIK
jgi:hypothetical protein